MVEQCTEKKSEPSQGPSSATVEGISVLTYVHNASKNSALLDSGIKLVPHVDRSVDFKS